MMAGFAQALPVILEFEGGFTHDTGGDTYQGVTQRVYDDYRKGLNQPTRPVRQMAEDERDHIYHARYWMPAQCERLPWPLSLVHFDLAVNGGVERAIKTLQFAVRATPDGAWGPETTERVGKESHDLHSLMDALLFARTEFYYTLVLQKPSTYREYFHGWIGRVIKLRKKAIALW